MQSQSPDLAPFRNINPWEVINGLFSTVEGTLNKGTFVSIASASGNPNVNVTGTGSVTPVASFISNMGDWGEAPAYATSPRFGIQFNKVQTAMSGDVVFGMTLNDVKEDNKYGTNYAYDNASRKSADQVVLSGESVPILTRGLVTTNAFFGTPSAGTGAYVSSGKLVPCPYNKATYPQLVGKFLEPAVNGFALFKLEL